MFCYFNPRLKFRLIETVLLIVFSVYQSALAQQSSAESDYDDWVADTMCAIGNRSISIEQSPSFTFTQSDGNNPRHLDAAQAGLTTDDFPRLELAWALAFPDTSGLRAAPVIVGSTLFYSATDSGRVFALDINSGCAKWVYTADSRLRSSIAYSEAGELPVLVFSDSAGMIHTVDAQSGARIWIASGQASGNRGMLTGTPVVTGDKVIVPISGSGVITGGNPNYECCENHGAVTALNLRTGEKLWEYHTMPAAEYTGQVSSTGVKQRGPSGAPIWTTPTVDEKRDQVYVTTGENTSHPTTNTSDAIIALDLESGEAKWVFQALENDMWNFGCSAQGPNCIILEDTNSVDFDFGGPAILVETADRDLLIAGQKSGDLWALNPDTGSLVWNQRVGEGTALGGNHWGIASNFDRAFMTINDPKGMNGNSRPGIYSYFVGTGEPSWFYEVQSECNEERSERLRRCDSLYGFSATPLSVDGAVITGGLDGRLFVFNSESGELIYQYDTVRDYETINGVAGYGGSIDSHSISAGSGMVFVGSGYGQFRQVPGNVLLAFKPSE